MGRLAATANWERVARACVWLLLPALAASLAWWIWRLLPLQTPAAAPFRTVAPVFDPTALAGQGWFGSGARISGSSGRYVLRWLYAGKPGVCILGLPGLQDRAFRVGDEVEPGIRVREVGADFVLLDGLGGVERIQMPVVKVRARPAAVAVSPGAVVAGPSGPQR